MSDAILVKDQLSEKSDIRASIWIINPITKKWLVEIDHNRTLFWRTTFFDRIFSIFGMDHTEYTEILVNFFESMVNAPKINKILFPNNNDDKYSLLGTAYLRIRFIDDNIVGEILNTSNFITNIGNLRIKNYRNVHLFPTVYSKSPIVLDMMDAAICHHFKYEGIFE